MSKTLVPTAPSTKLPQAWPWCPRNLIFDIFHWSWATLLYILSRSFSAGIFNSRLKLSTHAHLRTIRRPKY